MQGVRFTSFLMPYFRKDFRKIKNTSFTTRNSCTVKIFFDKKQGGGKPSCILNLPRLVMCSHDDLILWNLGPNKTAMPKANKIQRCPFTILSPVTLRQAK